MNDYQIITYEQYMNEFKKRKDKHKTKLPFWIRLKLLPKVETKIEYNSYFIYENAYIKENKIYFRGVEILELSQKEINELLDKKLTFEDLGIYMKYIHSSMNQEHKENISFAIRIIENRIFLMDTWNI